MIGPGGIKNITKEGTEDHRERRNRNPHFSQNTQEVGDLKLSKFGLVFAGLFGGYVAGVADFIRIEARGGKFGDLAAAAGAQSYFENLRTDEAASCTFVHREEVAAHPVPSVTGMEVVDADLNFELRLSPEARTIRRRQPDAGIEVGEFELAVLTEKIDSGLVVGIFAKVVVRQKFEAHFFCAGHLVFGTKFHPLAPRTDAVLLALVRAHGAALREGRSRAKQQACREGAESEYFKRAFTVHNSLQTNILII